LWTGRGRAPVPRPRGESFAPPSPRWLCSRPQGRAAPVHISIGGMYVQYQICQQRDRHAYPIVMVHGSGHAGKTYEETPDGRRVGHLCCCSRASRSTSVDCSGGSLRVDPTLVNQARAHSDFALIPGFSAFSNEQAWLAFRIGADSV
jgi:hypothetical protein